jgi:hypothetical protein
MTPTQTLLVLASAASLVACGPQTLGDLGRPALIVIVQEPGGFCSATYAVDSDDRVWLESGCESSSGLHATGRVLTAEERAELDAHMDRVLALPDDAACELPSPSAERYRFVRTLPDTDEWPETRQCEPTVPADAVRLVAEAEALVGADGGVADAGGDTRDAGSDTGP